MPNLPISQLSQSTTLTGEELLVNVQGGVTKKQTVEDILNADLPLTSSGITVSGDIIPATPQGATLGSIDKPFAELYLQSGSISIESDTIGDPSALISNVSGNLEISVGGMRLVEPGNSFIAETGSFQHISGSLTQIGDYTRTGDTIAIGDFQTTGSIDISGSLTVNGYTPLATASISDQTLTFTKTDSSTFNILLPQAQGSPSSNSYLIPVNITVQDSVDLYLTGSAYASTSMIHLDWSGSNGTMNLYLPDATAAVNVNRSIRFISDNTFETNTRAELSPLSGSGQTLDGGAGSYTINKGYEGIMVWSDGVEWYRIQTKAG